MCWRPGYTSSFKSICRLDVAMAEPEAIVWRLAGGAWAGTSGQENRGD
jgi:hypothetical protein